MYGFTVSGLNLATAVTAGLQSWFLDTESSSTALESAFTPQVLAGTPEGKLSILGFNNVVKLSVVLSEKELCLTGGIKQGFFAGFPSNC